jgi:hypothetical protein
MYQSGVKKKYLTPLLCYVILVQVTRRAENPVAEFVLSDTQY